MSGVAQCIKPMIACEKVHKMFLHSGSRYWNCSWVSQSLDLCCDELWNIIVCLLRISEISKLSCCKRNIESDTDVVMIATGMGGASKLVLALTFTGRLFICLILVTSWLIFIAYIIYFYDLRKTIWSCAQHNDAIAVDTAEMASAEFQR